MRISVCGEETNGVEISYREGLFKKRLSVGGEELPRVGKREYLLSRNLAVEKFGAPPVGGGIPVTVKGDIFRGVTLSIPVLEGQVCVYEGLGKLVTVFFILIVALSVGLGGVLAGVFGIAAGYYLYLPICHRVTKVWRIIFGVLIAALVGLLAFCLSLALTIVLI